MHRVLKNDGSIYFHCDGYASHAIINLMDDIFGFENCQNEISWCYQSPVNSKKRFCKKHDNIYFYSKGNEWTFNFDPVRIPHGDWAKNKINYKTSSFGIDRKTIELNQLGMLCPDYWFINIIGSSSPERLGYDTQKPEALLERIILASSKVGDIVLDPFSGTGTTAAVAKKNHRKYIAFDMNPDAIEISRKRLKKEYVPKLNPLSKIFKMKV